MAEEVGCSGKVRERGRGVMMSGVGVTGVTGGGKVGGGSKKNVEG